MTAPTKLEGVQGPRSPRWALWAKTVIPCRDGLVYLVRRRVLQCPWFAIYVHDINHLDAGRDPHDHPWVFYSFVLRGMYSERLYTHPATHLERYRTQRWKRFSLHKMEQKHAHRIIYASPKLKTLIVCLKRKPTPWGFFTAEGFVPWTEYKHQ